METSNILLFTLIVIGVLLLIMLIKSRFIKCPDGKMMIVYGLIGDGAINEVILGGSKFIIPAMQSYGFIDLSAFSLEYNEKLYSKDGVIIKAKMKISYAVSIRPDLSRQLERLLFINKEDIRVLGEDIIHGRMVELFKSKDVVDLVEFKRNPEFVNELYKFFNTEFNKVGIEIVSISKILIVDIEEQILLLEKQWQELQVNSIVSIEEMKKAEFELSEINNAINKTVLERNKLLSQKLKLLVKIRT